MVHRCQLLLFNKLLSLLAFINFSLAIAAMVCLKVQQVLFPNGCFKKKKKTGKKIDFL